MCASRALRPLPPPPASARAPVQPVRTPGALAGQASSPKAAADAFALNARVGELLLKLLSGAPKSAVPAAKTCEVDADEAAKRALAARAASGASPRVARARARVFGRVV